MGQHSQRLAHHIALQRDGMSCVVCGSSEGLTLHHIRPRHIGGRAHSRNLITLCVTHHEALETRAQRWAIHIKAVLVWFVYGPRFWWVMVWHGRFVDIEALRAELLRS